MASVFEGLHGYERVLLVLGVVLFVTTLIGVFVHMQRKQSVTVWVVFFMLSIAMVGFPGIKSIKIGGDIATLETKSKEVSEGTATASEVAELEASVNRLSDRPLSPTSRLLLAKSQAALGDTAAARISTQTVIAAMPENRDAKLFLSRLDRRAITPP